MQTIDRYIIKEMLKIFTLSVGALTAILFLDKILFLTELIINKGVDFVGVMRMMVYISPAFLALTIPMSVLVASVVVFSQLSADSELIAMRASGCSFTRLMRPVLFFSFIAYALTNFIMFQALPWGNLSFKKIIYDIVQNRAHFEIKTNVFNKDFDKLVLFVREKASENDLRHIFIADTTASESAKIILAEEGTIVSDPALFKIQLKLKNGTIHDLSEKRRHYQILNFDRYELTLDIPTTQDLQKRALKGNRELSFSELLEKINRLKKEGQRTFNEEVELSKKFSIPFTCLFFAFIGAPLGIGSSRSGKSGSFTVSIVVILLYYVALISTQNLGSLGKINSLFSVWIPNVIGVIAATYLVVKTHKEIPFKLFNHIEDFAFTCYQTFTDWKLAQLQKDRKTNPRQIVVDKKRKQLDITTQEILRKKMEQLETDKLSRQI